MSDPVIVYTAYTEEGGIRLSLHPEITSVPLKIVEDFGNTPQNRKVRFKHRAVWSSHDIDRPNQMYLRPSCRSKGVDGNVYITDPESEYFKRDGFHMKEEECFDWLLEELYP